MGRKKSGSGFVWKTLTSVVEALDDAAGARVDDREFLVVSVDQGHFRALEGNAKAVAHVVFAQFVGLLWDSIALDGERKSGARQLVLVTVCGWAE